MKINSISCVVVVALMLACEKPTPMSPIFDNKYYPCSNFNTEIFFVVLNKDGKNIIDYVNGAFWFKMRLNADTTKSPVYGERAGSATVFFGKYTQEISVSDGNPTGINYRGTLETDFTSLGVKGASGKGCYDINSIKFNGKPVLCDTTVGFMLHSGLWKPPHGIFIFQM